MSYYRDVYLKSEDWKNLRLAKLHENQFACGLCGFRSESNDVHHLRYKKLHDVHTRDLRILCRRCHNLVHDLLRKHPPIKKMDIRPMWRCIGLHLRKIVEGLKPDQTPRSEEEVNREKAKIHLKNLKRELCVRKKLTKAEKRALEWSEDKITIAQSAITGDEVLTSLRKEGFVAKPRKPLDGETMGKFRFRPTFHPFITSIQEQIT